VAAEPAPKVSVVIPTYGKSELLAATLASLDGQTYPAGLTEVVVADDCSPDETQEVLRGLKPAYRLVGRRHDVNRGRAAARNTAIRAATGDLVLFLDDDMRADPKLVEEHVRFQTEHHGAVVIGNALTAPELGTSVVFAYMDTRGVHKLATGERSPARYFNTNDTSVPRQALLDAGLFDEAFLSYGFEDMDIGYRLEERAGLSFWYCASAIAYHIHHHTLEQFLSKRLEAARSTLPLLLEKHPGRARDLSVEVLLPRAASDSVGLRARKTVVQAVTAAPVEGAVSAVVARLRPGGFAFTLMEYLIACQYRRGLALGPVRPIASGATRPARD